MNEMNDNLIDLTYEESQTNRTIDQPNSGLFSCEGVVSERKEPKNFSSSNIKFTSETQTQTQDENYLETIFDEFMDNREVFIEPSPFTVNQGFFTSYKLYTIMTRKKSAKNYDFKVNRRFSDFEWLSKSLITKYPGYIIPELPEKNFLASMNFEKSEFIEARRKDLENFLEKLLDHKYLRNAEEVRSFLIDNEKEFSIIKGKSEMKLKSFTVNFTKELVGFLGKKNQSYLKKQNDADKDLLNHKVFFNNVKQKAEQAVEMIENLASTKEADLKILAAIEINSMEIIKDEQLSEEIHEFNEKKINNLQIFTEIIDRKFLNPLKNWIKTANDIIAALKRREILDEEVFEDTVKIEEMSRSSLKTNNRRDFEMDLIQTRLDSNLKLLNKTTKTLLCEIEEYKSKSEQQFIELLSNFLLIHDDFYEKGGFVF